MPELPEVQTVLDTLETKIKDRKIIDIKILYKPIVECKDRVFKKTLINQHFRNFKRRGKYLLFEMDDITLVSHLRMEGKYFIVDDSFPMSKHDHVIFYLDNGMQLRYNYVRKFGRMELIEKNDDYRVFKNLGPEPFSEDFSLKYCKEYLKNSRLPIKQVLLDQSFVAGIGNIYADEILFAMKVNPKTLACKLTDENIESLIKSTRVILKRAIKAGGTTIRSYTSSLGVTGKFQLNLNVHTMEKCKICDSDIKKIVVGGRGTYYCPNCQKERKKIAITGTIGSGKTEVAAYLRKKGYDVFDCDETNRQILEERGYELLHEEFVECFDGKELNKQKLASLIFNNSKKREVLESILHPLILEEMMKNGGEPLFAEVPLLFESNWDQYFDENILIVCDENIAIRRLVNRGLSEKEAKLRIANQMPVQEKIKKATRIIYNNGSLDELYSAIDSYLKDIC